MSTAEYHRGGIVAIWQLSEAELLGENGQPGVAGLLGENARFAHVLLVGELWRLGQDDRFFLAIPLTVSDIGRSVGACTRRVAPRQLSEAESLGENASMVAFSQAMSCGDCAEAIASRPSSC